MYHRKSRVQLKLTLVDVDDGVEAREDPLDAHVGHAVAEGLVQVPLDLQLQLELLLEERLPLQPHDEAAHVDDVLPAAAAEGLLVGERAQPLQEGIV